MCIPYYNIMFLNDKFLTMIPSSNAIKLIEIFTGINIRS